MLRVIFLLKFNIICVDYKFHLYGSVYAYTCFFFGKKIRIRNLFFYQESLFRVKLQMTTIIYGSDLDSRDRTYIFEIKLCHGLSQFKKN